MPDQDIVVDPSEVKPAMPGGALLRYPPAAGAGDIEVDPSQISTIYDPAKAAAAQAALERGPEVRPEGAPLYQVAPRPENTEPPPMTAGEALFANPVKQVGAGLLSGAAAANRLTANTFHLFDTAASKIAAITGTDKGGIFKQLEDWAREQQKGQEQQAAELAGGRQDLPSQLFRTGSSAVASLPTYAAATELGGPMLGMAGLGALETADQGPKAMLEAAAQNALGGKALEVMGPASRPIRLFGAGAMTYAQLRLQGVDHETALANAMTMGGMAGMHPGGKTAGEIMRDAAAPGAPLRPEWSIARSTLNPTQQAAVDYLRDQGVPLTAGQQTGNRYLTAVEATTAHTPLGSQKAREFHAGTEGALRDLAGELAGQAHGEPVSPYEAGTIVGDTLTHSIGELAGQANQAYEKAWEHAGDPAYTKKVQIKTATEPVLDAAGQPTGQTKKVPVYADVNMPVDVRWMKAIARDQIPKYEYLPAAERAQSAAYSILKGILKGNDHISAQQAEEALKGLKAEVGYGTDPNMRNAAQGTAAQMVPRLQKAIDAAVGETGQDAVIGLQEGRKLHAQKMDFADVQKKLRQEPVQAFGQLTQGRDSGVNYLKEVAQRAPESLPILGRAYLDTLFEKAMKEGGWMRTDGVFKAWDNLGDQTKALLFPKEGQVRALDRFFLAQKITAERINTSGTALVKEAQDAGTSILKWLKGKYAGDILFSPKGIKFLTGIAQNPPRSSAEVTALQKKAEAAFGAAKGPEKPPEEPPEGQPPAGGGTPPTPPAAGGGGAAAPPLTDQQHYQVQKRAGELLPEMQGQPEGWREKLNQASDQAQQRIDQFWKGQGTTLNAGLPVHVLADYSIVGARKIVDGAEKFGAWSKDMLDTLGEQVQPHLRSIWKEAQHIAGVYGWGKSGKQEMPLGNRLTVTAGPVAEEAPAISQQPKLHLVQKSLDSLDTFHKRNPAMFSDNESYIRGMNELFQPQSGRVPIPPENLIAYANDGPALGASIDEVSKGQRDLATEGLAKSLETRKLYADGKMTPVGSGLYFGWAALSPRQSPYPQEAGFLHALDAGLEKWVRMASKGKFDESTLPKYLDWASGVLKETPGAQATSNLNSFGRQFLMNAGKPVENGPYKGMRTIDALHEIIGDQNLSSIEARRRYQQINKGLGVDNKVFSFILLVTGHHDTLVADRVRINDFWNAPGLEKQGIAYTTNKKGYMEPTRNLYDNGLNKAWDGITGLGLYEATEKALADRVKKAYADRGVDDGTLGRWHWETWLAKSGQEVSHGSLGAVSKMAAEGTTGKQAAVGESVRQGKYNDLSYGVRYERTPQGFRYEWTKSDGSTVSLTREQQTRVLDTLREMRGKKQAGDYTKEDRVIPYGTKTSKSTEAPWHDLPGINRQALDRILDRISSRKR